MAQEAEDFRRNEKAVGAADLAPGQVSVFDVTKVDVSAVPGSGCDKRCREGG